MSYDNPYNPKSIAPILPYGTILMGIDHYEYIYIGFTPANTVGNTSHVFEQLGEAPLQSRLSYHATEYVTLCKKFINLNSVRNNLHKIKASKK